jgi:hypothetical protein
VSGPGAAEQRLPDPAGGPVFCGGDMLLAAGTTVFAVAPAAADPDGLVSCKATCYRTD